MKILAIDTSNQPMTVALVEDQQLLATTTLNMVRNHSIYVMPTISKLCNLVGWEPNDLDRVVVAQGPGSYTGVRIAVTTAKVLADTEKIDLVGISSLEVLARNVVPTSTELIVPFFDARRGNVFAGAYRWQNQKLVLEMPEKHLAMADLLADLSHRDENVLLVGQLTERIQKKITDLPANVRLLPLPFAIPSAYQLALAGANATAVTDIDDFLPHYLRITEAEANWQKQHPGETKTNYVREV